MEFEKSVKLHTEKKNKKQQVNIKFLQLLKFGVDYLLNYEADNETPEDVKPCNLQIKMADGGRIILKLNPLKYTVKKLYALVEVIQFLNISKSVDESTIRTALLDKIEECILNQDLGVFKVINDTCVDEFAALDELEVEGYNNAEDEKINVDDFINDKADYLIHLSEANDLLPK